MIGILTLHLLIHYEEEMYYYPNIHSDLPDIQKLTFLYYLPPV
jgi:hypothetical protein